MREEIEGDGREDWARVPRNFGMGEEGEVEAFGRGDGRAGLDGKSGRGETVGSASREFDG